MGFLVKHYGRESTDNFAPMSLVFVQKQLVEHGYARPMVNRYIGIIRRAFKHGVKFGWVNAQTSYALQAVDNLKKGRTKAHEFQDVKPVDPDDIEKTLTELPKRIADMARIQRLCVMRPQDVCNLRLVERRCLAVPSLYPQDGTSGRCPNEVHREDGAGNSNALPDREGGHARSILVFASRHNAGHSG